MSAENRAVSNWRTTPQRLNLVGSICGQCGHKMFPPRQNCPECKNGHLTKVPYEVQETVVFEAPNPKIPQEVE
jgi:uncharacterized OB-fold protein